MRKPFFKFAKLDAFSTAVAAAAARPFTSIVLVAGPRGSGRSTALKLVGSALKPKFQTRSLSGADEAFTPLLAAAVGAAAPATCAKETMLFCDDLELHLPAFGTRGWRDGFATLEKNLRREHQVLVASTSAEFVLRLLNANAATLDTALFPVPCLDPGLSRDFRELVHTIQHENPGLFAADLTHEDEALRLQVECVGLPGLLFRQLAYAEQLALAEGRTSITRAHLRRAALEAFKLHAILQETRALHTALDNSPSAFRALSSDFGLNEEQLKLALSH